MSQNTDAKTAIVNKNIAARYMAGINWVVICVLLLSCILLYVTGRKTITRNEEAIVQKQRVIDSLKTDRRDLQGNFEAASARIDRLLSANSNMDNTLQNDKKKMMQLQQQISDILKDKTATQASLMQARDMIFALYDIAKKDEERIAEVEQDNKILAGENDLLSKERDKTVEDNIALKMAGSILQVSNIRLAFTHNARQNTIKNTTSAKKADALDIVFDIDRNRVATSGTKEIYIRIVGPDGNVLSSPKQGSGNMNTVQKNGVAFSAVKQIELIQGQAQKNVSLTWLQDGPYLKGVYTVEFYNSGYKIAKESRALN